MSNATAITARIFAASLFLCLYSGASAQENIDLESTFVGDREQPAVSYITPWKPPEGPDKLYRPIKSISVNVLDPVDREVLSRNIRFYGELSLEQAGAEE
jgi:hypothetical protein